MLTQQPAPSGTLANRIVKNTQCVPSAECADNTTLAAACQTSVLPEPFCPFTEWVLAIKSSHQPKTCISWVHFVKINSPLGTWIGHSCFAPDVLGKMSIEDETFVGNNWPTSAIKDFERDFLCFVVVSLADRRANPKRLSTVDQKAKSATMQRVFCVDC